jgi:hypothetical protein
MSIVSNDTLAAELESNGGPLERLCDGDLEPRCAVRKELHASLSPTKIELTRDGSTTAGVALP